MALVPSSSRAHHLAQSRPDLGSIRSLISQVNHHFGYVLSDPDVRDALQQRSRVILADSAASGSAEFPDQSVVSSLYYGIKSTEAATECGSSEEKRALLADAEKMLQVPALQEEDGTSAGIENRLLVSLAYFYLALVKKLQGDQWQMTIHFLQAASLHPELVRTELAPRLWDCIFGTAARTAGDGDQADDAAGCRASRRATR